MTICNKCAKAVCSKWNQQQPDPITCIRCGAPLTARNRAVKRTNPIRWMCKACAEAVIERDTDACFVCSRPFTPRAFQAMRKIQSTPHNKDARRFYEQQVQGRKIA